MEDRTDCMTLFMLTGMNMNNVMKDWMPPSPTEAPPATADKLDDPIIKVKTKKDTRKHIFDDTI